VLPAGLATVTVTGTWLNPDGTPRTGNITLEPEPAILTSAEHGVLILGPITASLDGAGSIEVELLATDDPDVTPTGWTYQVTERWPGITSRSYPLSLPLAAPDVDLADVAPAAAASEGDFLVITGPTGPAGPEGSEGPEGPQGPQPPLGDAGDGPDVALRSDDPTTADARTPLPHAASHEDGGADELILTQAQITGLLDALAALAPLAGATFTGAITVDGADLAILGDDKGYRFRRGGGALDLEGTGSDLLISNWSGTDFDGTQRSYFRLSADAQNIQVAGRAEFVAGLFGGAVHTIDGDADQLGFHGAAPVGQQTVTGSRADGTALASLLTALATLGLIVDNSTE
jgi:hypothetical protein